jgi:hypothetical protein
MTLDQRRKLWREYQARCDAVSAGNRTLERLYDEALQRGDRVGRLQRYALPVFPDELRGLPCGARTRRGKPCKRTDLHRNGRCKFHGGMSTGPKTPEGRARSLANLRQARRAAPNPV